MAAALFAALPAAAEHIGHLSVFVTPAWLAKHPRPTPAQGDNTMFYWGGAVLPNVKVVSVMWSRRVAPETLSGIPAFTAALVNSTFIDQLTEYNTKGAHAANGHRSTKQVIGRGTFLGQVTIRPHNTSRQLTDDDIQHELRRQIREGVLPAHDVDTLYMLYFPADISITFFGLQSCRDFGGYHLATNEFRLAKGNVIYAVMPDCGRGFDFLTFVASHELAEAITDTVPTSPSPNFPEAWLNNQILEIADLCFRNPPATLTAGANSWAVTQYYLNSTGACSTGNYTSP